MDPEPELPTEVINLIGQVPNKHIADLQSQRRGAVTVIELFAVWFVIAVPLITFQAVAPSFGKWAGIVAALISAVASVKAVVAFYRWAGRCREQEERDLIQKYSLVYRLLALPTYPSSIVKAEGTDIAVGDYGWDAEPIHDDGLTYLHGLTEDWQVAWYAGFRVDQIERIGPKPRLQYYLPYSWVCAGSKAPLCPFAVVTHPTTTLGYPIRIIDRWVQGKYVQRKRMA